jgi:phosphatidate cytidylyltransferase
MRKRVISAIVALILLAAILSFGNIALGVGVLAMSLIGLHELYNALGHAGYKPVRIIGYLACVPVFFISLAGEYKWLDNYIDLFKSINYASFGIYLIILILFSLMIFMRDRYNLNDISLTLFGIIYVPFLFAFIPLTRNLEHGMFFIGVIFITWATDIFAYFVGVFMGRNKLLPAISPKKTVEGAIGGVIGCVLVTVLYGIAVSRYINNIPIYHYVIIGILNGIISQIGDWAASAIKRYVDIKDYGRVMPGHGGVLDRFDSILFTAPVVYFYISFIITGS